MPESLPEVPQPGGSDLARKAMLAALSAIPFAAPIADMVLPSPFENRLLLWLKLLAEDIEKLQKRVDELDPNALAEDEEFMTMLLNAARIVSYSHRNEKHEMLRNAVLNSVLPDTTVDDEQFVFFSLLDEFTVAHIHTLELFEGLESPNGTSLSFSDPQWRLNAININELYKMLKRRHRGAKPSFHFFVSILADLSNRELISNSHSDELDPSLPLRTSTWPQLTNFGRRFLDFIESPLDDG